MSGSYFMLKFLKEERHLKRTKLLNKPVSSAKCRICLQQGVNIQIFNSESSFNIQEAICIFGGIDVNENDDLPKHLCDKCFSFLENAVSFRKSAQDNDTLLRLTPQRDSTEELLDIMNDNNVCDTSDTEKPVKTYNCNICKLTFNSLDQFMAHKKSKSHKKVRIQCPMCHRLLTSQLYQKHLARHQAASHLVCEVCGKLYRKDNLARHMQLHSYDLPFKCLRCPYRGRFMESLKIHMRTHSGDKPYSCDKCEMRFLTRSNLSRHLLTHKKDRLFKCLECGRGFNTKRDVDVHFKADHTGVKEFVCKVCGNKYGTRKALMRHELRVHKRDKMAKGRMPLYLQAEYQNQEDSI